MVSSRKNTKSPKIFPYNLPLTRVRNQKESQTFIENHRDLLSQSAFRLITHSELLNQWCRAKLGIQEVRMLHNLRMGFDEYYYFLARPSLIWDVLVVNGIWKGEINGVRVTVLHSYNLEFSNELEIIEVCHPELIHYAMKIPAALQLKVVVLP
ncbi:hypothetical protein D8674_017973 [Pyrus ussuriensis x Pyrus communis]|uniref:Uncharacterized protein n=1 Tax=Pyrus ussuriensis x Pyrus communis TaxID=2448454 RepID=A0A5N5HI88_9ROSA|nr:hypothetical protein D8674_017973 [Pyrus ussuriensis x Pyrus communis]